MQTRLGTFIVLVALVFVASCDPWPRPYPCSAIRLSTDAELEVLTKYSGKYFSTECPEDTPLELSIKNDEYSLYVLLMASQTPRVFIGLEDGKYESLAIDAPSWHLNPEGSVVTRASHWTSTHFLQEQRLQFEVQSKSGLVRKHDYSFELVDCICKSLDGP